MSAKQMRKTIARAMAEKGHRTGPWIHSPIGLSRMAALPCTRCVAVGFLDLKGMVGQIPPTPCKGR